VDEHRCTANQFEFSQLGYSEECCHRWFRRRHEDGEVVEGMGGVGLGGEMKRVEWVVCAKQRRSCLAWKNKDMLTR